MNKRIKKNINNINLSIWIQTIEFEYCIDNNTRKWKETIYAHCSNRTEAVNKIFLYKDYLLNKYKQQIPNLRSKLFSDLRLKNEKTINNQVKIYSVIASISEEEKNEV